MCPPRYVANVGHEQEIRKKGASWWQSGEGGSAYPQERLADFEDLLDRRVSQHLLEAPEEQVEKIRRLHAEFRNPFAHFVPMGWAIEKSGLPQMIKAAMQRLLRGQSLPHGCSPPAFL